jgi:SagB-type dehydrogenase family enzyme
MAVAGQKWLAGVALLLLLKSACKPSEETMSDNSITLPEPKYDGRLSVEEALLKRRSIREYTGDPLTLNELAQLLWAAQGITDARGYRTAPSAGATYPLEIYAAAAGITGIAPGIYRYEPESNRLLKIAGGDKRADLTAAAIDQQFVAQAPVSIIITAIYERTTGYYGQRGVRYVDMEAGHAAQNVYLQAAALGLGTVAIGAFDDSRMTGLLALPNNETPLYIMPVGRPAE